MAEAVVSVIAQEIERKLESLSVLGIGQRWNLIDEFEKIKLTVSSTQAVLPDAEEKSQVYRYIKTWLEMLKEILQDVEDMLDELSADELRQQLMTGNKMAKEVRRFLLMSNQFVVYGRKIKDTRVRLDEIAAERRFHLELRVVTPRGGRAAEIWVGKLRNFFPSDVVIGREHHKARIMERLLYICYEEYAFVIAIVGIGGLGKTTLAKLVFNDERVKMHFDLRVWVFTSNGFDAKLIVEKILESVSSLKTTNYADMEALNNLLWQTIDGKRFLIVLDDVWDNDGEKWLQLRDLLLCGAVRSKILLITPSEWVTRMTSRISPFRLHGLDNLESWSLFEQIAFKPGQVITRTQKEIGMEILERCFGFPIAIKIMAGILYFKDSESEWLSLRKEVEENLSHFDGSEDLIFSILRLSYRHLSSHLKQCFAYCMFFPKCYEIDVEMLIQLWIAQGYVVPLDSNQCLEDVGIEYFAELLVRHFFHDVEQDIYGNYKTCKMHYFIHDLATEVAREECASLPSVRKGASMNAETRHVSFHFDSSSHYCQVPPSLFQANKLRTFLRFGWGKLNIKEDEYSEMFSKMKCLRMLDLHDLQTVTLTSFIDRLKLLRYLDLSENTSSLSEGNIKTLPDSITKLQFLQVLKLNRHEELTQLPNGMKKLVYLTHLGNYLCYGLTHIPRGIGQLTSLEKLSEFVLAMDSSSSQLDAGLDELHDLNKLGGQLRIKNLNRVKNAAIECKAANLRKKQRPKKLELE